MWTLRNKLVKITWMDPDDDWPFFIVLGYEPPMLHLKGADDPIENAKHDGDEFYVNTSEIKMIEPFESNPAKDKELTQ